MSTTIKFKSIWYSFFQAQNSMLIQKSIKHVDKFDDNNRNKNEGKELANNASASSSSSAVASAVASRTASTSSGTSTPVAAGGGDDYRLKREKNNESVRKSRAKSRVKLQECATRVHELRTENNDLNNKLSNLQSELFTLRGLFHTCFSLNNTNKNQVKPNEIPTSTLYKLVMQNQHKLALATPPATPTLQSTPQVLPITNGISTTLQQQPQAQQPPQIKESDDEFFINELKNALINCVSYPDSPTSSIIDQQLNQNEQQAPNTNDLLNLTGLVNGGSSLGNEEIVMTNEIQSFLNEFDADASSSSFTTNSNNDPLLSSPLTSDSDLLFQENFAMLDHDYTLKRTDSFVN